MPVTTPAPTGRYYADLNPSFGAKYERRWVIWLRPDEGELPANRRPLPGMWHQFVTRRAAERAAERLNAQDRRDVEGYP